MTTSEFREKYPHLAHLEGDDLWDAMSKAVFIEKGGKMIESQEELEKVLREHFTDDRAFGDRFSGFGLLIPTGNVGTANEEVPAVTFEYNSAPEGKPDIKNMSFDEVAKWAKKQSLKPKAK